MKKADLELCYLSATEALSKFKSRELSPVALCKALIQRNTEIGEKLNATTYTFFDRALKEARQAEAKYKKSKGARLRPLEGIPISIKDFHSVKGEITTYGSKAFENNRPDNTAPTVERLLKAGAILFARTTTPEFAHSGVTKSTQIFRGVETKGGHITKAARFFTLVGCTVGLSTVFNNL